MLSVTVTQTIDQIDGCAEARDISKVVGEPSRDIQYGVYIDRRVI